MTELKNNVIIHNNINGWTVSYLIDEYETEEGVDEYRQMVYEKIEPSGEYEGTYNDESRRLECEAVKRLLYDVIHRMGYSYSKWARYNVNIEVEDCREDIE